MAAAVQLIVGLGNPGPRYEPTRHNAGFWFVDTLARHHGGALKAESKFHGDVGKVNIAGEPVWLLKPQTFMNRSGQAVAALAKFYKIDPQAILVAHDELDFPPGKVRLKQGGGHGGHNGLRDIISALGNQKDFWRLRIGIGHPGEARMVSDYVLKKASPEDQRAMDEAVDLAADVVPLMMGGDFQKAMNELHRTE